MKEKKKTSPETKKLRLFITIAPVLQKTLKGFFQGEIKKTLISVTKTYESIQNNDNINI